MEAPAVVFAHHRFPGCIDGAFDLGESPLLSLMCERRATLECPPPHLTIRSFAPLEARAINTHLCCSATVPSLFPSQPPTGRRRRRLCPIRLEAELIRARAAGPILFATLTRTQLRSANPRWLTRGLRLSRHRGCTCPRPSAKFCVGRARPSVRRPGFIRRRSDLIGCSSKRPPARSL